MGCLLAPFRALGCLLLLVGLAAAWLYRDRLWDTGRGWLRGDGTGVGSPPGRPGTRALAAGRARIDSLARGTADSVVLGAAEAASLLGAGLDPLVRRQLDSLELRLRDGRIEVGARLATGRLPRDLVGLWGFVLRDREPVRAAGPLAVREPGRGEWTLEQLTLRGVPVPADLVPVVLDRLFGEPGRHALPVALPRGVHGIRVRPSGLVLLGANKR
ncbi:MAG TPA: hypothetical protein VFU46_10405 [Gemmatimonadales bacterium]|nr:hypothetical protein [Gemmatimonadales bacterium]